MLSFVLRSLCYAPHVVFCCLGHHRAFNRRGPWIAFFGVAPLLVFSRLTCPFRASQSFTSTRCAQCRLRTQPVVLLITSLFASSFPGCFMPPPHLLSENACIIRLETDLPLRPAQFMRLCFISTFFRSFFCLARRFSFFFLDNLKRPRRDYLTPVARVMGTESRRNWLYLRGADSGKTATGVCSLCFLAGLVFQPFFSRSLFVSFSFSPVFFPFCQHLIMSYVRRV